MTEVRVVSARGDEYAALLREAGVEMSPLGEVLLAEPALVDRTDLEGVRWIQSTWAGVDGIDWARVPREVPVTGLPGVFGPQMAEFVFAHLLARTQRVPQRHAMRTWDATPPEGLLRGTSLGILGAGSIGESIAAVGKAFGMTVRGCRRSGAPSRHVDVMFPVDRCDEFVEGLDHLVAILPATPETVRLVDRGLLERLARGASFVNVGRGSTVDTDAVVAEVRSGRLGLAVLDVTDPQPLPDAHPAWLEDRIVVTGHTAALSDPRDVIGFFVENLRRFASGEPLAGLVDRTRGY